MPVSIILLDIEGTTTSISFVKDVLFKFVRETLPEYLSSNFHSVQLQKDISALRCQIETDLSNGLKDVPQILNEENSEEAIISSVLSNVFWNMDQDRKIPALKELQGHMWKSGYESGAIVGHFYEDVKSSLEKWTSSGKKIYIYSSGSEEAQKLIFTYSLNGNLSSLISGYFDTKIGLKIAKESYSKISEIIGVAPAEILFLTDNPAESTAATEAGLNTKLVIRPGNSVLSEDHVNRFGTITSFSSLNIDAL